MDNTLDLINGLKLLNLHLWGDEDKICITDTFEFSIAINRASHNKHPLKKFLDKAGAAGRLDSPSRFSQWDFWRLVCSHLREEIWVRIKALERLSPPRPLISLPSLQPSIWICASTYASKTQNRLRFEVNCSPPEIFIPVPNKTELGGCARSDSLVRPLTF